MLFKRIQSEATAAVISAKTFINSKKGEGYVDTGVKILIAVVIGALLLALLYTLFNSNIMPTVTEKVQSLFNYTGAHHPHSG